MKPTRKQRRDARQRCKDCGAIIDPTTCYIYGRRRVATQAELIRNRLLVGIYCSTDCLLDSHVRGWPRMKR